MHTPGPWRRGQEGNLRVYGPDGQGEHSGLIATVHRGSCMNVIVEAPELLSALISLSNEVFGSMPLAESAIRREIGNTNYNCIMRRAEEARAVIAKATGA